VSRRARTAAALTLAAAAAGQSSPAQVREVGEVALHQAILDARTDQHALLVASHPDDQYLHPAALLRFRHGWRVSVALLTRGEGGQNVSGPETGDALAMLRTAETERCAARLGFDVHFLDRPDAGYCRSAEEALDLWGRVATSNDLARLIRSLGPDVVWTTHHPGEEHGHDLALLRILPEALERAASPLYRWEGLPPYRVPVALRGCAPDEEPSLTFPGDGIDLVRGRTYRELAYQALAEHRSQAPFRSMDELYPEVIALRSVRADDPSPDLLAPGDDLFRAAARAGVAEAELASLRAGFERDLPALVADRARLLQRALELRRELIRISALPAADPELQRRVVTRSEALDAVIVHALSIVVDVAADDGAVAVAGEDVDVRFRMRNADVADLERVLVGVDGSGALEGGESIDLGPLPRGGAIERTLTCRVAARPLLHPLPGLRTWLIVEFELAGQRVRQAMQVPIVIRPGIELEPTRSLVLWPRGRTSTPIAVRLTNHRRVPGKGVLHARVPVGWRVEPANVDVELVPGASRLFTFVLGSPPDLRPGITSVRVGFPGAVGEVAIHGVDVTVPPGLRVGLVPGVDDASRRLLEDLGVELHVLDGDDVGTFPLAELDTILIDIRALRTQETVRAAFGRLLQFIADGGRLVVLYPTRTSNGRRRASGGRRTRCASVAAGSRRKTPRSAYCTATTCC